MPLMFTVEWQKIDRYYPLRCWVLKAKWIDDAVYFADSQTPRSCPAQDEQITMMQFSLRFVFLLDAVTCLLCVIWYYSTQLWSGVVKFIWCLMLLLLRSWSVWLFLLDNTYPFIMLQGGISDFAWHRLAIWFGPWCIFPYVLEFKGINKFNISHS